VQNRPGGFGMEHVTIHAFSDFLDTIKRYQFEFGQQHGGNSFVFRGMRKETWPLLPSLFREYDEPRKSSIVDASVSGRVYISNEFEILTHFIKEASGILPHIPQSDVLTWMQYAQHFGAPTRLMDFTTNPLIALYFCCEKETKEDGVVWIISVSPFQTWSLDDDFCDMLAEEFTYDSMIESIMKNARGYIDYAYEESYRLGYEPERSEKMRPVFFTPAYIDQRMNAQSSRFLLWGEDTNPLEMMVSEDNIMNLSDTGARSDGSNDEKFLTKIIVSASSKHSIMKDLDLFGVNDKTVFPGLDSIGRYIEKYYKNNPDDVFEYY
jgi:hypothetical protein